MEKKKIIKISSISLLSVGIVASVISCIILKSGKQGNNGSDGKANSIEVIDDKLTIDGEKTNFNNQKMSAMINVSSNNDEYGEISKSGIHPLNTAVNVFAKPYEGYIFSHWENENGDVLFTNSSFVTKATSTEQNYVAIFDIDRSDTLINVYVKKDISLPSSISVFGGGEYRFGDEYELSVTSTNEKDFEKGYVLYYEINKEQYEDDNFKIDFESMKASASGKSITFEVNLASNKYYSVAYKLKTSDIGYIDIVASSNINLETSNELYGNVQIAKLNNSNYDNEKAIFPDDEIVVKATPTYVLKNPDFPEIYHIERSDFLYWINLDTNKIVSYEREYKFVVKGNTNLKAVFQPKTIIHFNGYRTSLNIISGNELFREDNVVYDEFKPVASFYEGEELLIYCSYLLKYNGGLTNKKNKFSLEISFNKIDFEILSYDKQAWLTIPSNVLDIYIRVAVN